jgi:hypothetical protein
MWNRYPLIVMGISKNCFFNHLIPSGVTKKIFLEMAKSKLSSDFAVPLRLPVRSPDRSGRRWVFVSWRLRIFTPEDSGQGRKDFAKNPKHIWLNVFMQYFLVSPQGKFFEIPYPLIVIHFVRSYLLIREHQ